jgi:hypothetical protein
MLYFYSFVIGKKKLTCLENSKNLSNNKINEMFFLGAWNMRGKRVFQGANIKAWGLLICNFFGKPFSRDDAYKFQTELVKAA